MTKTFQWLQPLCREPLDLTQFPVARSRGHEGWICLEPVGHSGPHIAHMPYDKESYLWYAHRPLDFSALRAELAWLKSDAT